jgi:hypothetical protein
MDWIYVITAVVAIVITVAVGIMVRMPSRIRWFRRVFFLVVAALFLAAALLMPLNMHAKITGYFIAVLMGCFGLWRQGFTNWGIIAGLGATRVWGAITLIEVSANLTKHTTLVEAFVGSIRVSRLTFNQSATELAGFIEQVSPNTKVKIM